jgi:hypothetical protein
MEACSHNEIIDFLDANKQGEEYGDCKATPQPQISPPAWKPNPNVPIFNNNSKFIELQNEIMALKEKISNQAMQSDSKIAELENEIKALKEQLSNQVLPAKVEDELSNGLKLPSDIEE